jgi:hypothetical protein
LSDGWSTAGKKDKAVPNFPVCDLPPEFVDQNLNSFQRLSSYEMKAPLQINWL